MWIFLYAAFLAATSLITFLLYAVDKKRAVDKKWRIPEKTLLSASFFGGAVGGYLAMQIVRHKTRRWYFHAVNLLGLAWQIGLLAYLFAV